MTCNQTGEKCVSKSKTHESRAFDYFYDPIYTAPNVKGPVIKSHKVLPNFDSMFSDIPHFSRKPAKKHVTADEVKQMDFSQNLGKQIDVPKVNLLGRDRYKYFVYSTSSSSSSPSPTSPSSYGNQNLSSRTEASNIPDIIQEEQCDDTGSLRSIVISCKMCSVQTQTDYRDSETQTDPYSPPYILRQGSDPELLMLTPLTWGNGLPASKEEIDLIREVRSQKIQQNLWTRKKQDKNIWMDLKLWTFKALWLKRLREQREQHLNATVKMEKDHHEAILQRRLVERRTRIDRFAQLSDESDTSTGCAIYSGKE